MEPPGLPRRLQEAGAVVDEVVAYRTRVPDTLDAVSLEALRAGQIDWVTFTSSSTAKNLVALLGEDRSLLEGVKTASIGPVTSKTLKELGLGVTVEAGSAGVPPLIQVLCDYVKAPR